MNAKMTLEIAALIECARTLQALVGDVVLYSQDKNTDEDKSRRMLIAVRNASNYLSDQLENELDNILH